MPAIVFCSFVLLILSVIPSGRQRLLLFFTFLWLFVFSAFRGFDVGTDTINYMYIFDRVEAGESWLNLPVEPSWVLINEVVAALGGGFRFVLVISTVFVLAPVFLAIKRSSPNPMFSVFVYYTLYFYFYSFNITRQMVAVSFVLLGFTFILQSRKLIFTGLVLLASTFHLSALVCLPLVFLERLPVSRFFWLMALALSMLFGLFGLELIYSVVRLTGYSHYLELLEAKNLLGSVAFLFILNSFYLFTVFTVRSFSLEFRLFSVFFVIQNLLFRLPFGGRLLFYLSIFQVVFFPYYFRNLKISSLTEGLLVRLAVVLLAYCFFYIRIGDGEIIPYQNVLFGSVF